MIEFGSEVYIATILILTVLLLGMLIERLRTPKRIREQIQEHTQKQQQIHKQEIEQLKKQHERNLALQKEKTDSGFSEERLKADRALSDLEREREISKIAASVSNEQSKKIQFLTELAQEFRNPLSVIMESIEDMLAGNHGKLQGKTRRQLEVMLRNTRLLLRGMDLFHDVSNLQSGKMEIARTRQDMVRFLREIVQTVAWYAEKKKIDLRLDTNIDHMDVFFDTTKMAEVLYHVVSNAFKFTERNGKILIALTDLSGREEEEDTVQIRIRNSGKAIPAEDLPHLFDPFKRNEKNRPRLGLSLVKELISQHGGSIQARSDPDVGTEFTIILPKGSADTTPVAEEKAFDLSQRARMELSMLESEDSDISQTPPEGTPRVSGKILIVEDNESLRELLKSGLRDFYAVAEAQNGIEALEKVTDLRPDLIITDVMMPGMDGLNFCRQMKTDPELTHIPIILITAKSSEHGRLEGMEAGADAYIAKPFGFEELLRKVEQLTKTSVPKA